MADDLTDRLRDVADEATALCDGCHVDECGDMAIAVLLRDAADRIEALEAERDAHANVAADYQAQRDAALADVAKLREAIDAGERAFNHLNEPDELWMVDDSYEHRATGAAIVRNAIRRALADTEEAKSDD